MVAALLIGTLLAQKPFSLPAIGLALGAKEGAREEEFLSSVRELIRLGVDGSATTIAWRDLEPTESSFESKPVDDMIGLSKLMDTKPYVTIRVIDTTNKVVPEDLMGEPWNSPRMKERLTSMLRNCLLRFGNRVPAISIGNEVDIYLAAHPDEVAPYLELVSHARAVLKQSAPDVRVGVTTTFEGHLTRKAIADQIQKDTDILFLTYYGVDSRYRPKPVTEVAKDFQTVIRLAGQRKIVMQEIGLPASPDVGSSDELQAEFVRTVFSNLRQHREQIEMASFFSQFDFSTDLLNVFVTYYQNPDSKFRSFLGSLGMRRRDGSARPALTVFREELNRR
jgi:hypothetical protein